MLTKALKILVISTFLASSACAEDASSPVAPNKKNDEPVVAEEEHLELPSLLFKGKDPFGSPCNLYISASEHEDEDEGSGDHGHKHTLEFFAKVDYSVHGESPLDTQVNFYRYSLDQNKFFPEDSTEPNTTPTLASIVLNDKNEKVDINKMTEYEQKGQLAQSLRIDFSDMDIESFEESLEAVVEDDSTLSTHKATLDQMNRAVLKLSHNGHYDSVACSNFQLSGVENVEFDINASHDDDDHDHGHDH